MRDVPALPKSPVLLKYIEMIIVVILLNVFVIPYDQNYSCVLLTVPQKGHLGHLFAAS